MFAVLDAAESRFATVLGALESVCTKPSPSEADYDYVATHLAPGTAALGHVFELLPATWLEPLRDRRVFADPPDVLVHDESAFSFPRWPQAEYLARIASNEPIEVARTIIEVVPTVNNESVHSAFLDAASRMPAGVAARVAEHESAWIARQKWISGGLPQHIEALVALLVDGGETTAATSLLRAALSLAATAHDGDERTARFDSWSYGLLVEKTLPALGARAPAVARELLHELIGVGHESAGWDAERHIGDAVYRETGEPSDFLFAQLRDLYVVEAGKDEDALRAAVAALEGRGSDLCDRLAVHLLRVHGQRAPGLAVERAVDQQRLDRPSIASEIALMLRDQLPLLESADQQRVITALRENASEARARVALGASADASAVLHYARRTLLRWLYDLGLARPAGVAHEYEELVRSYGEPAIHQPLVQVGPDTPRRAADLLALTNVDLLSFLKDWTPVSRDPFEPSREGLGREIKACAAENAERFSRLAREFRGLHASYVSSLLWGLHEELKRRRSNATEADAAKTLSSLDWDSIMDLLEWTVAQRVAAVAVDTEKWRWANRMALDVAGDVAAAPGAQGRAARAVAVVHSLMRDSDPSPEREAKNVDNLDTFAMNTVRGQAVHAAIEIAGVLRTTADAAYPELVASTVAELARSAESEVEPCLAVRCVLAMRFNELFNLNADVAATVRSRLFPRRGEDSVGRRAAWTSFLSWNPASGLTFRLLQDEYVFAVQSLESASPEVGAAIGKHLTRLAVFNEIDPAQDDGLIHAFIKRASTTVRAKVLHDLGFSLYHTKQAIPQDVIGRIRAFWELWWELVITRGDASDLAAFGWCVGSEHFDPTWLLVMLERVLNATRGAIEMDHAVAHKLASLASTHPGEVAACLRRFVDGREEWPLGRNRQHLRAALTSLSQTGNALEARQIASRLVARGQLDFRDLAQ